MLLQHSWMLQLVLPKQQNAPVALPEQQNAPVALLDAATGAPGTTEHSRSTPRCCNRTLQRAYRMLLQRSWTLQQVLPGLTRTLQNAAAALPDTATGAAGATERARGIIHFSWTLQMSRFFFAYCTGPYIVDGSFCGRVGVGVLPRTLQLVRSATGATECSCSTSGPCNRCCRG